MNAIGTPNIELFDIDSGNVNIQKTIGYLEQMGFLLCRRGNISLMLDDRIYNVRAGYLFNFSRQSPVSSLPPSQENSVFPPQNGAGTRL